MKKGQLIRRKLWNGTPIGPYLKIEEFKRNATIIVARMVNGKGVSILFRNSIYEPKVLNFILPDKIIERIQNGLQNAIIHDISVKWNHEKMAGAEVVLCRSVKYSTKFVIMRVDDIKTVYWNGKPQVRLQLGEVIESVKF